MKKSQAKNLISILKEEVQRASKSLRVPSHPLPYYISNLIRDIRDFQFEGKYGTLSRADKNHARNCFADVRIGSYRYDHVQEGGLDDNSEKDESYDYIMMPVGDQKDGIRHALWRLNEARYREAVNDFLRKKADEITYVDPNRAQAAFEKGKKQSHDGFVQHKEPDPNVWEKYVCSASKIAQQFPEVKDSYVSLSVSNRHYMFVNSEGTEIIRSDTIWTLSIYLWFLSKSGDSLSHTTTITVADPQELPSLAECKKRLKADYQQLEQLSKAEKLRSYSGPVLLDPIPAGLLVHESVGHRLEGSRLLSTGEGQTFRDSIGKPVLPSFLSVFDKPTLKEFEGNSLIGHYQFDDEGAPAQAVQLIDRGILKDFLRSRTPVTPKHKSNGHGRNRFHQRPISRMGVTVVQSHQTNTEEEMLELLRQEVVRQGLPFGIRIIEASGGETATDSYNFQAFMGEIELAAKVYPDGRQELVRGVNFVGTPLNAIRNIIAAGNQYKVDNAYCGAESGSVPVSTISPSLLVSELELQSKQETQLTQYSYLMPWEEPEKSSSANGSKSSKSAKSAKSAKATKAAARK